MKKTARNDVTGDFIVSKPASDMFNKGYDQIDFSVKLETPVEKALAEYELNKSTGEVQKVDNGDTTNPQK